MLMYADDTLLPSKGNSVAECERNCQDMLDKLTLWCDLN